MNGYVSSFAIPSKEEREERIRQEGEKERGLMNAKKDKDG